MGDFEWIIGSGLCPASIADSCPNVDFDWMLGVRLVPGLLSFLVTAGSSVGLYLDSGFIRVNDIFPKHHSWLPMPVAFPCSPPGSFGNSWCLLMSSPAAASTSGLCLRKRWCHLWRVTFAIRIQLSHRPCSFAPRWFASRCPSFSRPFRSLACESESLFVRIVGETSRRRLSWLCALPRSNGGQFPRDSSPNASNTGSSASDSLRIPS